MILRVGQRSRNRREHAWESVGTRLQLRCYDTASPHRSTYPESQANLSIILSALLLLVNLSTPGWTSCIIAHVNAIIQTIFMYVHIIIDGENIFIVRNYCARYGS